MPRDLEAEEHARQHLEEEGAAIDVHDKITAKRDIEGIEDMLANLTITATNPTRPSIGYVRILKDRLKVLSDRLNLQIDWSSSGKTSRRNSLEFIEFLRKTVIIL
jgi:hypothetical protein